jgi:hypothetical protein
MKNHTAYKLFAEGTKLVEVAIQLGISEKEATRYYTEYRVDKFRARSNLVIYLSYK